MCIRDRFIFCAITLAAQDTEKQKNWELHGYIKDLQSLSIISLPSPTGTTKFSSQDNFLHNRLNFRWFPSDNFTLKLELRNRFFWGDQIRLSGPEAFKMQLEDGNDFFDLDIATADQVGIAAHSIIDRFYGCLLYTSPSPRDATLSRMPSSA